MTWVITRTPAACTCLTQGAFEENWHRALEAAIPWAEQNREGSEVKAKEASAECERLAREPRILEHFAETLARIGVAGESRVAMLLYLVVTSRVLDQPVSAVLKGPSSGGKSYLTKSVLLGTLYKSSLRSPSIASPSPMPRTSPKECRRSACASGATSGRC